MYFSELHVPERERLPAGVIVSYGGVRAHSEQAFCHLYLPHRIFNSLGELDILRLSLSDPLFFPLQAELLVTLHVTLIYLPE